MRQIVAFVVRQIITQFFVYTGYAQYDIARRTNRLHPETNSVLTCVRVAAILGVAFVFRIEKGVHSIVVRIIQCPFSKIVIEIGTSKNRTELLVRHFGKYEQVT